MFVLEQIYWFERKGAVFDLHLLGEGDIKENDRMS